jgi:hypothetical protein
MLQFVVTICCYNLLLQFVVTICCCNLLLQFVYKLFGCLRQFDHINQTIALLKIQLRV